MSVLTEAIMSLYLATSSSVSASHSLAVNMGQDIPLVLLDCFNDQDSRVCINAWKIFEILIIDARHLKQYM